MEFQVEVCVNCPSTSKDGVHAVHACSNRFVGLWEEGGGEVAVGKACQSMGSGVARVAVRFGREIGRK